MIIQHPVIDVLRLRYKELQHELRLILEEWFTLQHSVRPDLIKQYDVLFGGLEIELQRCTLQSSEIQRRVELFTIRAQRGNTFNDEEIRIINEMVDNEFKKFHKRINESFTMTTEERDEQSALKHKKETSVEGNEITKLYRAIVKHLHPDVNGDTEVYNRLWNNVQEAYQQKNTSKLRTFYNLLCIEEHILNDVNTEESGLERLRVQVHQMEMKIDYERRKLQRSLSEEPFTFAEYINNTEWITQQKKKIQEQIHSQKRIIELAEGHLRTILGTKWEEYKKTDPKLKEQFDFQDDFMENTYFSMRA